MNREQRRVNGHQPKNVNVTISRTIGLEPLSVQEAAIVSGNGHDPNALALVKIPIAGEQNISITGVGADGTVVLTILVGIPPGLLAGQLGKSRLVDANGIPSGAAAVLRDALAPLLPMFVFGVWRNKLSEAAQVALLGPVPVVGDAVADGNGPLPERLDAP